jgi:hypothetical protein
MLPLEQRINKEIHATRKSMTEALEHWRDSLSSTLFFVK